ncbi:MAG: anthrax toxin-like adenylyl cyclase domain-containing protein [Endozoicomonas sp.]
MAGPLLNLREDTGNPGAVDRVIDGLSSVQSHSLQGLARPTLMNFMKAASSRDMVFLSRFVEPISKTLIEEGLPTKHYRIKTKSANWGLQSGTIPTDQAFSKKAGDPSKVEMLNSKSRECLKDTWQNGDPVAVSTPLKVSSARIQELEAKGYLYNREELKGSSGNTVGLRFKTREKNEPDGVEHTQEAWLESDGKWKVYEGANRGTAIEVLAQPPGEGEEALPYTADVDPLLEAFPLSDLDLGGKDRLPLPLVSDKVVKKQFEQYRARLDKQYESGNIKTDVYRERLSRYESLEAQLLKDFYEGVDEQGRKYSKEDPDMGNVTPRTRDMVKHYKEELGRRYPLVHHNVDAHSLATDESANYPVTAFFPKSMGYRNGIAMIFNEEQLVEVFQDVMKRGYAVEQNPLWGKARVKRPSFVEARILIEDSMRPREGVVKAEEIQGIDVVFDTSVDPTARAELQKEMDRFLEEESNSQASGRTKHRDSILSVASEGYESSGEDDVNMTEAYSSDEINSDQEDDSDQEDEGYSSDKQEAPGPLKKRHGRIQQAPLIAPVKKT